MRLSVCEFNVAFFAYHLFIHFKMKCGESQSFDIRLENASSFFEKKNGWKSSHSIYKCVIARSIKIVIEMKESNI